jgi:U4/U6 small nuclear ribonucleoprotein PRP31
MSDEDDLLADLGVLENEDVEEVEEEEEDTVKDILPSEITRLVTSKHLLDVIENIESEEVGDRYQFIVKANALSLEIENEIRVIHKFIRDIYEEKFPELEGMILNVLDYAKTVKAIGNETDLTKIDLNGILTPSNVMVMYIIFSYIR